MQFCKTYNLANGSVIGTFGILLGMALLVSMPVRAAKADALATDKELPDITMIPGDGMNLAIDEVLNPNYVIVKVNPSVHNWFAGTFTNLPTDKDVTIGLSMEGMDTPGNKSDVTKWRGLMPVMTYGDPTKYETYEWYQKDEQGRWVSGDPFKQGETKHAGNGKVPEQSVIPNDVAEQFLSMDGKYWQPWREVDHAEAIVGLNIFRVTQKFDYPTATIAMRVPYTYTYLQEYIRRVRTASLPNIYCEEMGITAGGRRLQAIVVDPDDCLHVKSKCQTILVIAREHATEHSSSWALQGMLNSVMANTASGLSSRNGIHWIFIPIEDPDGSVNNLFDSITERFSRPLSTDTPIEVFMYARYLTDYVNIGNTIDMTLSWHNIECNEGENLFSPLADNRYSTQIVEFNRAVLGRVAKLGYTVGRLVPSEVGTMNMRLYGWCARVFSAMDTCFEINDRLPYHRMTLRNMLDVGTEVSTATSEWCHSTYGREQHLRGIQVINERQLARDKYFIQADHRPELRTRYELITLGY